MSIEWRDPQRAGAGKAGYIGKVQVFSLNWGVVRERDRPWVLRCLLPGYHSKEWYCADEADANDRAMRIWETWLRAVGLITDEPPVPEGNRDDDA